jgi:hypothetical protein
MSGTHLAAGGPENSITTLLAQLSESNRAVEARLISQIHEELRGLSFEKLASVLQAGVQTVKRDWRMARAWLKLELSKEL